MLTGGCRPLNPRRRYQVGRVDRDLRISTHSPIQSLSPFGGAPLRQGQANRSPLECLILEKEVPIRIIPSFIQTGGFHPLHPRRRYQVGRVDRDLRISTHSPIQSLSPFGGAPLRQGQAKRSPLECLILEKEVPIRIIPSFIQTGGFHPLHPRRRYQVGRVDRDLRISTHSPIQSLSQFWVSP